MKTLQINIDGQNIFFRTMGSGDPIILLHPSPSSSKMFIPFMEKLAPHCLVIAIDTPGYGDSQPLIHDFKDIKDYTTFLKKFFIKIGLEKFSIYGSATGAQIGIRYAIEHPDQVEHLFLDNAAHFTDKERVEILKEYFPDLTPQLNGSHLTQMWKMVTGLFQYFPWFKDTKEFALNKPMPPTMVLHAVAKDYLLAGKNYWKAYKAAFYHERAEYISQLKTPTSILRWEASIIKSYTDRFDNYPMPSNVQMVNIPADRTEREKKMVELIKNNTSNKFSSNISLSEKIKFEKTSFSNEEYPKLEFDADGNYLLEAWNFLKEKNKTTDAEILQEELKDWMLSI